jgi:hypothetical protein
VESVIIVTCGKKTKGRGIVFLNEIQKFSLIIHEVIWYVFNQLYFDGLNIQNKINCNKAKPTKYIYYTQAQEFK